MKKMNKALLGAAALMLIPGMASAEMGVGARFSTLGYGVELGVPLTDSINIRAGLNRLSQDDSQTIDGIAYDATLDLSSTNLMLDWHPFEGSFHLSAGYVASNNELRASATPANSVTIGTNVFTPAEIGRIDATVGLGSGPYVGFGWGNLPASGFGFSLEVGVVQMGVPSVDFSITDPNGIGAVTQADINAEIANIQADLNEFEQYPVVSLGLSYGF